LNGPEDDVVIMCRHDFLLVGSSAILTLAAPMVRRIELTSALQRLSRNVSLCEYGEDDRATLLA
jgi:hypothetical protein